MRLFLQVTPDYGLVPTDDEGIAYIYKRDAGAILQCDVKTVRNYENHKRYFKFLQITFDMQEHFTEFEYYRHWLTMKAGYFDTIVAPNGNAIYKAHSLSFADMDEDIFKKVFSSSIDVFLKEFGNGLTEDALLEIIGFA